MTEKKKKGKNSFLFIVEEFKHVKQWKFVGEVESLPLFFSDISKMTKTTNERRDAT